MAFSMGWRGTTWVGVNVACQVAGEKDCRLLTVNMTSTSRSGARPKGYKGWL